MMAAARKKISLDRVLLPWLGGFVVAAAFCAGYLGMFAFRQAWQSHYPALADQWANNGRFAVVGWFGTEITQEELGFAARVNNASRHVLAYDPFIRDSRSVRQLLVDKVSYDAMGLVKRVVGEINWTWIVVRFLCCWAWFVLIYFLALRATDSPPVAAFAGTVVACFSYTVALIFLFVLEWKGGLGHIVVHNLWAMLSYGRTEGVLRLHRPGVTYAFLFFGCLWLVKAAETRTWKWAVLSGVLGGVLAYVHLDTWTTYLVAAGFYTLISWKDRPLFLRLLASLAISTLLSLPFLATNYPPNHELVLRGVITSQLPPSFYRFSLLYLIIAPLVLWYRRKPIDRLLACLCLSAFVMTNIGFVLGYQFEPTKWEYIGNIFVFLIAVSLVPPRWKTNARPWHAATVLLILITLLQGLAYAAIHYPFQGIPKDYDSALRWLDRNTPAESEVMTVNAEINVLIPAYTHDSVSLAVAAPVESDYPLAENYKHLLGALRLLGADVARFSKECVFTPNTYDRRSIVAMGLKRGEIEKQALHDMLFLGTPEWYVQKIVAETAGKPADIRPDYLWIGVIEKNYASAQFLSRHAGWEEVYRNPSVILYGRAAAKTARAGS